MDSVSEQLANGRRLRVLNEVNDFSQEMIGQLVSVSISGRQVARFLEQLSEARDKPHRIICDNVTEFSSKRCSFGVKKRRCHWALSRRVSLLRMTLWKI